MLRLFKRRSARSPRIDADPSATQADLQIRNLLDDPNLRFAMGLDSEASAKADLPELEHAAA